MKGAFDAMQACSKTSRCRRLVTIRRIFDRPLAALHPVTPRRGPQLVESSRTRCQLCQQTFASITNHCWLSLPWTQILIMRRVIRATPSCSRPNPRKYGRWIVLSLSTSRPENSKMMMADRILAIWTQLTRTVKYVCWPLAFERCRATRHGQPVDILLTTNKGGGSGVHSP